MSQGTPTIGSRPRDFGHEVLVPLRAIDGNVLLIEEGSIQTTGHYRRPKQRPHQQGTSSLREACTLPTLCARANQDRFQRPAAQPLQVSVVWLCSCPGRRHSTLRRSASSSSFGLSRSRVRRLVPRRGISWRRFEAPSGFGQSTKIELRAPESLPRSCPCRKDDQRTHWRQLYCRCAPKTAR